MTIVSELAEAQVQRFMEHLRQADREDKEGRNWAVLTIN